MKGTRDLKQWEARRKRGVELYKKGWNQYQIAEVLGVTQPSVSKWVRAEAAGGDDSYDVDTDYMAQSRRYMPGEASEEQYRYYAKDRQGSVSMMTAHNDGTQIQELYHYDAWGEHLPGTTPPAVENKIRYVGARVENFRSGTTDAIYHMGSPEPPPHEVKMKVAQRRKGRILSIKGCLECVNVSRNITTCNVVKIRK